MKQKGIAALLAGVLFVAGVEPVWAADWQAENPLIAHALGEADGKIETNSREAFIQSWQNGYRVVEGDFTYTSDGVLVLRHDFEADGSYYRLEIEPQGNLVMDANTFRNTKAVYTQTPITAADLLALLAEYPDMYLVTDTKDTDKATVQRQFSDLKQIAQNMGTPEVLERIIPQIYQKEMLGWVKEIYDFPEWIFTLYLIADPNYADIAAFCAENGIGTVTLQTDRATKQNIAALKEKGLAVYVHTVNRYRIFEDLLENGADGIYTDRIKPYELEWVGLENPRKLTEETVTVGSETHTLTTLEIFGESYAPLRQLATVGRGFSAKYDAASATLDLQLGKTFQGLGNELLLKESGRLVTEKAAFRLTIGGEAAQFSCFLVDGEVYAPVAAMCTLLQK